MPKHGEQAPECKAGKYIMDGFPCYQSCKDGWKPQGTQPHCVDGKFDVGSVKCVKTIIVDYNITKEEPSRFWKLKPITYEEMEYFGPQPETPKEVEEDKSKPCKDPLKIRDCKRDCSPAYWLGNGICDDGKHGAHFKCELFWNDGGDCNPEYDFSKILHYHPIVKKVVALQMFRSTHVPVVSVGVVAMVAVAMVLYKRR